VRGCDGGHCLRLTEVAISGICWMIATPLPDTEADFAGLWRARFASHPGPFRVFAWEPETERWAPYRRSLPCALAFLEAENTDHDFDPAFMTMGEVRGHRVGIYRGEPVFYAIMPDSTPRLD